MERESSLADPYSINRFTTVVFTKLVLFTQLQASQHEKKGQPNHCQFLRLLYGQLASVILFYIFVMCDVVVPRLSA